MLLKYGSDCCCQRILLCLGFCQIFSECSKIGLDLRLGSGGTNDDLCAAFQLVHQNIGCRESCLLRLLIISYLHYRIIAELCRRILAQPVHNAGHLVHTGQSRELKAVYLVQITAIFLIDLLQTLFDGGTNAPVISCHLTDEHGTDNRVLVT